MKKNLTEMVFILDKSGSMSGLEADTIGGFNSMIEKQKKEDGEARRRRTGKPWFPRFCFPMKALSSMTGWISGRLSR